METTSTYSVYTLVPEPTKKQIQDWLILQLRATEDPKEQWIIKELLDLIRK